MTTPCSAPDPEARGRVCCYREGHSELFPHRFVREDPPMFIPTITFGDDAIASAIHIMHALVDYNVDLDIPENTGYPAKRVYIVRIDSDGDVVVAETDESGTPLDLGGTWAIPINLIREVKVL